LLLLVVNGLGLVVFLFVYDFYRGDISVVALVILELYIVVEQKVHKPRLFVLWQLAKHEGLRLIDWGLLEG